MFQVLAAMKPNSALLGWGTEDGIRLGLRRDSLTRCLDSGADLVETASAAGVWVNAADWAVNLEVFTNFKASERVASVPPQLPLARPQQQRVSAASPAAAVHTVHFLMTDGDNIQCGHALFCASLKLMLLLCWRAGGC